MTRLSVRLAALLLALVAVPIMADGVRWMLYYRDQQSGYLVPNPEITAYAWISAMVALYGFGHIAAAVGIVRGHEWARWLGLGFAALGLTVGLIVLPTAFDSDYSSGLNGPIRALGPNMESVFIALNVIPYALIFGVLLAD
jgi:hypothetical protein